MIYVKINSTEYQATINGKVQDGQWDNRESKAITMEGTFTEVDALFQDGTPWSIVQRDEVPQYNEKTGEPVLNENGNPVMTDKVTEFDNSEFCIRGDLAVHVDGSCTVKMGKYTDLETAYELMYGGM